MAWRRRRRLRSSKFASLAPVAPNPNSRVWRCNQIQNLCNSPNYFYSIFEDPSSPFVTNVVRLSEVFGYTTDAIKNTDAFKMAFGDRLCQVFYTDTAERFKYSWGGYTRAHNADFLLFIDQAKDCLLTKHKEGLLTSFLANWKNFNPVGKKKMAGLAREFVPSQDPRAIDILRIFLRNLKTEDITGLLEKIPQGFNNQEVQKIIKHTKTLEYLTFNEQAFNNDLEERKRMVKAIGKTPSLVKRLPFKVTLTLEDLNNIAPAMRFDFVQYALQYEIRYVKWGYTGNNLLARAKYWKERNHTQNLVMPLLTFEQMKELLFSVCLKKHAEFSTWMELYNKYLTALNAQPNQPSYY